MVPDSSIANSIALLIAANGSIQLAFILSANDRDILSGSAIILDRMDLLSLGSKSIFAITMSIPEDAANARTSLENEVMVSFDLSSSKES